MDDKTKAVTAVFTHPQKGFLMYQRDSGNGRTIPYPNTWSFFGGTLEEIDFSGVSEESEAILACLIREMDEELELKLIPSRCNKIHVYEHDSGIDHVFHCPLQGNEDEYCKLHEGKQKQWMTLEQIKKLPLAWHQESLLPIIETLSF